MRRVLSLSVAVGLLLGLTARVHAEEPKDILEKAIKAQGAEDKIAKLKAATGHGKGTVHQMGMSIPFQLDVAYQFPGQARSQIDLEIMGMKFQVVNVLNGDKGWAKIAETVTDLDEDALKEAKEQMYGQYAGTLVVLRGKEFTLAPLGEIKVDGKPAVGFRVSHKDHRDISYYFDKETYLLAKSETRAKEPTGQMEVNQESFYYDYKDQNGMKVATKFKILNDGTLFLELEDFQFKLEEKVDENLFNKP